MIYSVYIYIFKLNQYNSKFRLQFYSDFYYGKQFCYSDNGYLQILFWNQHIEFNRNEMNTV